MQLRESVERELQRLQDLDIIEPVNEPSTWVSPIVVVPKADTKEIRICVDMREHKEALATLKWLMTQHPVMAYFNPTKLMEICVDASPVGLGAILTQKSVPGATSQVVAYASRALTTTEQKYSQLEREALAILWACQHFHLYIYGSSFTVITDHKPLEKAFQTPTVRET